MNKNKFKTLGKVLGKAGINIDYQIDWAESLGNGIKYTDQPRLGSGTYSGIQGWYFTKNDNQNWSAKEKKTIREVLKKKGYKCKGIDDYEVEYDNDRSYRPSISFILNS